MRDTVLVKGTFTNGILCKGDISDYVDGNSAYSIEEDGSVRVYIRPHQINVSGSGNARAIYDGVTITERDCGERVNLVADARLSDGKVFDRWVCESVEIVNSSSNDDAYFIMPGYDVNITAVYKTSDSVHTITVLGDGNPGAFFLGSPITEQEEGKAVALSTNELNANGDAFDHWMSDDVAIENASEYNRAYFIMPNKSVVVKAVYKHIHVDGTPVIKNLIEATCSEDGSYDSVVYCSVCNEETGRTHHMIPSTGNHDFSSHGNAEKCALCGVKNINYTGLDSSVVIGDKIYTGSAITSDVTILGLTKGVDYTVDNVTETEKGTYTVKITGIGDYAGERIVYWQIVAGGLYIAAIPDQTYTGAAIKPVLEVYCDGVLLTAGKDYTITYGKYNTNVAAKDAMSKGKSVAPSVTITGKGNYSEKKTMTFAIVPLSVDTATVNDMLVAKSSKAIKVAPTVKLNGKTLKLGTDYIVSTTTDAAGAITSLKTPGQYDLYVVGKGNYTGYAPFKFTITEKILTSKVTIGKIADQKYDNGNEIKPAVKVTYNKKDKTADFDISYKNNTEIGTATVTITAKSGTDFVGTKTATFKITGTQMKNAKLGANGKGTIPSRVYDGTAYEPALDLYEGSSHLTQGTDYEVTYTKNVNAGTATATVVGKGRYAGSKKFTYKITAYNAETDAAGLIKINDGADISVVYDKGGSKPNPVVKAGTKVLTNKKDYTISYANQTAVKDKTASKAPKMTITFKGNYSGKKTVLYSITKKDIGNCTMTIGDMVVSTKANGWKQTKATIKDTNGKALKVKTDYDATFRYFSDAGCTTPITVSKLGAGELVYVKVTGIKNYEGTITGSYRISQKSIASAKTTVTISTVFTGEEIKPTAGEITVKLGTGKSAKTLTAGTDYEVVPGTYKNNVNKGTASVTIRGINDYCGTKVVTYKIGAKKFLWWEL